MLKHKRFLWATALSALLLALVAAGFFLFPGKLLPYDEIQFLRPKPANYQGVIRVWQINDWRVGGFSRTNLIQGAARRFEKKNIGVYIEFENVTPELFAQRIAEGRMPDVLSFPDGFAGADAEWMLNLAGYAMPPLADPFRRAVARDNRAVPWMAGGQLVLTNSEVGRAVAVEPPQADNTWNAAAMLDYASRAATGRRKKPVTGMAGAAGLMESLALNGVTLADLTAKALLPEKAYDMTIDQARGVYTTGKCAVLLCTQWEAALMGRLAAKNKAFDYALLPWPSGLRPCLSVQFAAARASGDEAKDAAEAAFVASLLALSMQKDIANKACCLPVIPLPEDARPQGEVEKMLAAELPVAHMPLPFVAIDKGAVTAALGGDKDAANKLLRRFAN